jgi:multisubunit Na+/H+ antiporter MnhG subunit
VRARRTAARLLGACAALTALVGMFQLADILRDADRYDTGAWIGVLVALIAILALIAVYGACALNRATLRTRMLGRLDLFQLSTAVLLVAITAGILIPTRNTTALALLLPWGISYWVHGLEAAATSDET